MTKVLKIVRLLRGHFGSQGWWPTTPPGEERPRYHSVPKVRGLSEQEQFEICVGALLTQNTAWTNVEKAMVQLQRFQMVDPGKIARAPFPRLARLVRSSGYFRQKSKRLKMFALYLNRNYAGKVSSILKKPLQAARSELLGLHGFGPETADSILLYAGGRPLFVVDAYTKRIGNRIGLFKSEDYGEIQDFFHRSLPKHPSLYNECHALFVALGKEICQTKPLCRECPLRSLCATGKSFKEE
ncbi:MAG: hypothetical protein HYY63_03705 [Elusimicrobia bacterium]|nr:hypothetical protein [Elusimicrobiota bacterium]